VRQSALLTQDGDGLCRVVYAQALPEGWADQSTAAAPALLAGAGRYRAPEAGDPHGWVRLALRLQAANQPPGLWLLGRRDPDDYYAAAELPVLQALADQLAVALVNTRQTQLLRALYQANVHRTESERQSLARELHDGPLNTFGLLAQKVVGEQITPDFRPTYTAAVAGLRHTIAGLRPVMLNYGLATGLRSLVSELAEQWPNGPEVVLEAEGDGCRYPEEVETHAYRIVQQACQNALRHAQARAIRLAGTLTPERLDLVVEDDGLGFELGPNLTEWLERHHFGLAGMHERAALIGGGLHIESAPGRGTRLRLVWPVAAPERS
jgi:signal transduction histidine kinase